MRPSHVNDADPGNAARSPGAQRVLSGDLSDGVVSSLATLPVCVRNVHCASPRTER